MFGIGHKAMLLMQRCVPFGTRCCRWRDVAVGNEVCLRHVATACCRYHTATNPYFAISKAKTALKMVIFIKLSKGHSCYRV